MAYACEEEGKYEAENALFCCCVLVAAAAVVGMRKRKEDLGREVRKLCQVHSVVLDQAYKKKKTQEKSRRL